MPWLVSYAVGTLLGAALLDLVPQALSSDCPDAGARALLAGIFTFFVLEKLVLWRHCHDEHECDVHTAPRRSSSSATRVHTFVDGVVIAAATLVSLPLGVTTALAVAAHEIPQEAGDFAILLAAGYSRSRALRAQLRRQRPAVFSAPRRCWCSAPRRRPSLPYVLAFAAGNFLYVAMADLIPNLHRGAIDRNAVRQIVLIALGVGTIVLMTQLR